MLCTPWHHCVNANASSTLRRSLHTIHKRLHILLHERLQMQVMGPHRFNPDIPIPAEATAIHGITDADVAPAQSLGTLLLSSTCISCKTATFTALMQGGLTFSS